MVKESDLDISITSIASVSALGTGEQCWESFRQTSHLLKRNSFQGQGVWAGNIPEATLEEIRRLRTENNNYRKLDPSVLYAIWISRQAVAQSGWDKESNFGINIGSSRGATTLFEDYHRDFLLDSRIPANTSPSTTLGNISSWVAQDMNSEGPELSHSITCSTSLHALLNGVAWIRSGLADKFLVGGSEAPLTNFTIAQMQALKIYSNREDHFPCRALDFNKSQNTMVLGEGAVAACLEKGINERTLARIEGIGYGTEPLEHAASFSEEGECLRRSMEMACEGIDRKDVDIVVMHAPGTIKGDKSEFKAIQNVFGEQIPAVTTNKWQIGHTLGASGMMSIHMAILMLEKQQFVGVPFVKAEIMPKKIERILVNAVGFGGNAVSILLSNARLD